MWHFFSNLCWRSAVGARAACGGFGGAVAVGLARAPDRKRGFCSRGSGRKMNDYFVEGALTGNGDFVGGALADNGDFVVGALAEHDYFVEGARAGNFYSVQGALTENGYFVEGGLWSKPKTLLKTRSCRNGNFLFRGSGRKRGYC